FGDVRRGRGCHRDIRVASSISDRVIEVGSCAFSRRRVRTMKPLPFRARREDYEQQARQLLDGHRTGDADAIRIIHENHPRFLDETITWRPKFMSSADIQQAPFDLDDARLPLARWYTFAHWAALK